MEEGGPRPGQGLRGRAGVAFRKAGAQRRISGAGGRSRRWRGPSTCLRNPSLLPAAPAQTEQLVPGAPALLRPASPFLRGAGGGDSGLRNWRRCCARGVRLPVPRATRARQPVPLLPHNSWTPGSHSVPPAPPHRGIMSRIESLTRARIDRSKELASKVGFATPLLRRCPQGALGHPPAGVPHPQSPGTTIARASELPRAGDERGGWGL